LIAQDSLEQQYRASFCSRKQPPRTLSAMRITSLFNAFPHLSINIISRMRAFKYLKPFKTGVVVACEINRRLALN
jgi:hypothetical protein